MKQMQNSKLPLKNEAILGVFVSDPSSDTPAFATALRTTPPAGVPGVEALAYSGAYPFSRLALNDSRSPLERMQLFAYSYYAPGSAGGAPEASGLPLVVFSLLIKASPKETAPRNVSFLLSLPLSSSLDTARPLLGGDTRNQTLATLHNTTARGCLVACSATPRCLWWTHTPAAPPVPARTMPDSDCAGDDILTPPRIATATLQDCIDHCETNVPGCGGVVYDQIASEQQTQCGNAAFPSKSYCLPKTGCSDFTPKLGDTAWARGYPGTANDTCVLFRLAPAVQQFLPGSGARSGIRGAFSTTTSPPALTLRRPSSAYDADPAAAFQDPAAATASYSLLAVDTDATVTFAAAPSLAGAASVAGATGAPGAPGAPGAATSSDDGVWSSFAAKGRLPLGSVSPPAEAAGHGAIAAMVSVMPGETRTISLIFAWHLPNRTYVGQEVGNNYAGAFADALEVAQFGAANLADIVGAGVAWNTMWTASSLPVNWQDFLMNSVSTQAKLSVWASRDRFGRPLPGGRFRQYEAYSGCDLAPVHVLDYSMLPYAVYFPALLQNTLLTGWAAMAQPDGMIRE